MRCGLWKLKLLFWVVGCEKVESCLVVQLWLLKNCRADPTCHPQPTPVNSLPISLMSRVRSSASFSGVVHLLRGNRQAIGNGGWERSCRGWGFAWPTDGRRWGPRSPHGHAEQSALRDPPSRASTAREREDLPPAVMESSLDPPVTGLRRWWRCLLFRRAALPPPPCTHRS